MEKNYVAPSIKLTTFHCPHCGTKASQKWYDCYARTVENSVPKLYNIEFCNELASGFKERPLEEQPDKEVFLKWEKEAQLSESGDLLFKDSFKSKSCDYRLDNVFYSVCSEESCKKAALWIHDRLIYPASNIPHQPHEDMPDEAKKVYVEANEVFEASPRAASALLRICCEILCKHETVNASGDSLNAMIGDLVSKGLDPLIQKALDTVRVIGNDAVHSLNEIQINDDKETAQSLFLFINEIVEEMISRPSRIEGLYEKLPESKRAGIEQRDTIKEKIN